MKKSIILFMVIILSLLQIGCKKEAERPNILFIMTDQQSAEMMSCTGNKYLKTPALDDLAQRGMRFELAYSPNPVCIPSRTAMVTGMFPSAFNLSCNEEQKSALVPEDVLTRTMGKLLAEGGYECVFGGKTHWAKGLDYETTGFRNLTKDHRDVLAQKCAEYLKQDHESPFLLVASFMNPHDICYQVLDQISEKYNLPLLSPNGKAQRETIDNAIALAEKAREKGVFEEMCPPIRYNSGFTRNIPRQATASRFAPPNPEHPKAKDVYFYKANYVINEMIDEDWRMYSWIYHRLTEDADRQIGIVLNALRENGLEENTIVVFISDHGEMNGAHKKTTKSVFYDESSRVPFIIAGPGVKKGVVDHQHLVSSSVDLIPTFCEYAGVEIPGNLYGKSIRKIARGESPSEWRTFVVSENTRGRMYRTMDYKYIFYKDGSEVLFDMKKDPGEMENLAVYPEYHEQMKGYRQQLKNWVQQTQDPVAAYLR